MAATMLATLNFRKPTNEEGIEYEPDVSFTNGTTWYVTFPSSLVSVTGQPRLKYNDISHPRPFKCNIQPRSVRTVALVSGM